MMHTRDRVNIAHAGFAMLSTVHGTAEGLPQLQDVKPIGLRLLAELVDPRNLRVSGQRSISSAEPNRLPESRTLTRSRVERSRNRLHQGWVHYPRQRPLV
jgi:hypothetical protein